jgi:rhodanese-related sulfurtransferase
MSQKSRKRHTNQAVSSKKNSPAKTKQATTAKKSFQYWWLVAALAIVPIVLGAIWIFQPKATQASNIPASEITIDEAYTKYQQGVFLLDVRTKEEWEDFHAPNTTWIPLDQLADRVNELPKDEKIVVVCRSGNRSQQGRDILLKAGFSNVSSMSGGLNQWRSAGYPTVSGP